MFNVRTQTLSKRLSQKKERRQIICIEASCKMSKAAIPAKGKASVSSSSTSSTDSAPLKAIKQYVQNLNENDRNVHRITFLHFVNSLVGSNVELEFNNASRISGVFHTATPFDDKKYELVVKQVRHLSGNTSHIAPGSTVITDFDRDNYVVHIKSSNLDLVNKKNNDLMTDGAIQRNNMSHLLDRELRVASEWVSDPSTTDNTDFNEKGLKNWNQFDVNREKFNVQSTYDENLYTKKLDRSLFSKEDVERAERIAKEIESTASNNLHMQMERGLIDETDFDEEEAFGGVVGTGGLKDHKSKNNRNSRDSSDGPWARNVGGKTQSSNSKPSNSQNNKNNTYNKSGNDTVNKMVTAQSKGVNEPPATNNSKTAPLDYSKIVKAESSQTPTVAASTAEADTTKDNNDASKEVTADSKNDDATKPKTTKLNANAAAFVPGKSFVPRAVQQQQPPLMYQQMHPTFDHNGMPIQIDQFGQFVPPYMPVPYGHQYMIPQQYAQYPAMPNMMVPGIGNGYPVSQGGQMDQYNAGVGYNNGRNNKVNQPPNNVDNTSE